MAMAHSPAGASTADAAAVAALHRVFTAESVALERRHGLSDARGASLQPLQPGSGLARVMQRLVRGQQVVVHVVGGSAAAGAGGVGVNHTFDARLVAAFNHVLEQAEEAPGARRLGRLRRSNVAQGGTSSFWGGLLGEALHGTRPSLVLWECAIHTTITSIVPNPKTLTFTLTLTLTRGGSRSGPGLLAAALVEAGLLSLPFLARYAINDHSVALDAVQRVGGGLAAEASRSQMHSTLQAVHFPG